MVNDDMDHLLIDRYLAGELSAAERARVDGWMTASASNARYVERLRTLRDAVRASARPETWDRDALRREMQARIAAATTMTMETPAAGTPGQEAARPLRRRATPFHGMAHLRRTPWTTQAMRIAAALLVAAAGGTLLARGWDRGAEAPAEARVVRAARGQLVTIPLVDGSRVTLAAGSAIDIPVSFGQRTRDVVLHGQAYFEVASDAEHPFRVHGGGVVTEVVGTRFGVRAYEEDDEVAVVVAEGRVAVRRSIPNGGLGSRPAAEPVVLDSGDLARLGAAGAVHVEHDADIERELGWVDGRLTFVGVPLREVVREIERWYDVPVVIDDSGLADTPVSAAFRSESLREMIELLAVSLDARVEQRNGTLHVMERR